MMTTDTRPVGLAYERTPECPAWCQRHEWGEVEGGRLGLAGHEAILTRGDVSVTLAWYPTDNSPNGTSEPFVDLTPEYMWLQGQSVRDYAALLVEASEILEAANR